MAARARAAPLGDPGACFYWKLSNGMNSPVKDLIRPAGHPAEHVEPGQVWVLAPLVIAPRSEPPSASTATRIRTLRNQPGASARGQPHQVLTIGTCGLAPERRRKCLPSRPRFRCSPDVSPGVGRRSCGVMMVFAESEQIEWLPADQRSRSLEAPAVAIRTSAGHRSSRTGRR